MKSSWLSFSRGGSRKELEVRMANAEGVNWISYDVVEAAFI
jgi:hypothetical protein